MERKIVPLRDNVLVELEPAEKVSAGGIILPETAMDARKALMGKVLAVGPGKVLDGGRRLEPQVKVGDRVLVSKYEMKRVRQTFAVEDERLQMVSSDAILAVVESFDFTQT